MTKFRSSYKRTLSRLQTVLLNVEESKIRSMLSILLKAKRVFVLGLGRSGLVLKCFAIRLIHMGFSVAVVGETMAPPAKNGDALLVSSASGKTKSTFSVVKRAREYGLQVILISATRESPMSKLASAIVHIPLEGLTNDDYDRSTLFEESVFILCEALVPILAKEKYIANEMMSANHANLEIWG